MTTRLEFGETGERDAEFDTSESTELLKARASELGQEVIDAVSGKPDITAAPMDELGAVVRELRSRGIESEFYSEETGWCIVSFDE